MNGGIAAQHTKTSAASAISTPTACGAVMSSADKEDTIMKKKTLSILSLCIALFAALALVGCGGSASSGGPSGGGAKSESKEKAPAAAKTDFI